MGDWKEDLKKGQKVEDEFIEVLKYLDNSAYRKRGYCREYDIVMPSSNKLFEVKYDDYSKYSSNWCFEYKFRGEASGLAVTKADYFVMVDDNDYWIFRTDDLKAFIRNNWDCFRKTKGGNNNDVNMVLVKKSDLANYGDYCKINRQNPDIDLLNGFING